MTTVQLRSNQGKIILEKFLVFHFAYGCTAHIDLPSMGASAPTAPSKLAPMLAEVLNTIMMYHAFNIYAYVTVCVERCCTCRHQQLKFDRGLGPILQDEFHWLDVPTRVFFKLAAIVHRYLNGRAAPYLSDYCVPTAGADNRWHLHSGNRKLLAVPCYRLNTYSHRAFSVAGLTVWISLPDYSVIRRPTFGPRDTAKNNKRQVILIRSP